MGDETRTIRKLKRAQHKINNWDKVGRVIPLNQTNTLETHDVSLCVCVFKFVSLFWLHLCYVHSAKLSTYIGLIGQERCLFLSDRSKLRAIYACTTALVTKK